MYFEPSKFPERHQTYPQLKEELVRAWEQQQAHQQCRVLREELMAVCWHPDRVEKLLELGILEEMW
jgi:hypothetical protein